MPLYKANSSLSGSVPDVSIQGIHRFSYAVCPNKESITKRPTYVMINAPGTYKFSYENTPTNYITGSVLVDDNGPIKLDISPTAWAQTDATGTTGDITFVYVRVS